MGLTHDTKFIASEEIPLNSAELIQSVKPPIKKNTLKLLYKAFTARHAAVWNTHLESLMVQQKFIDLIPLESESPVWSRIITSLPADQLSFLLRAGIDCLPTPVTLSRWRYQCDSSCKLCHYSSCTVHHILNCCPASLNQGRYTWRHDSVLRCLYNTLQSHFLPDTEIYADLPGLTASDSPPATLPLRILVTSARPDIVIIDGDVITLLELTIPINTKEGLQNARDRKLAKENYITLIGDLHTRSFKAELETVEVGSLGHFSSDTIQSFQSLLNHLKHHSICTLLLSLSLQISYIMFSSHF